MGIRESINKNSVISTIAVVCTLVAVGVVIAFELKGSDGKPPTKSYYTTDDGKTWFVDSAIRLPPFDHDGAQAVRCLVFKGPGGKFAGLLEKYSDDTRAKLAVKGDQLPPFGTPYLVKKPGEKDWKSMGADQEAMILMHITAPDGSSEPERVIP